jgi:hypothetical protein
MLSGMHDNLCDTCLSPSPMDWCQFWKIGPSAYYMQKLHVIEIEG